MDRTCPRDADHDRTGASPLRRWILLAIGLAACTSIIDFGRVVAIDVVGPTVPTLEEGDTLRMAAYGVSAAGDSVPDAEILWSAVVPDSGTAVVSIDTSGLMTGLSAGTGAIQARHRSLATPLITVIVTPQADTISSDSVRFATPPGETTTMTVTVTAFPDTGTTAVPVADNAVHFIIVEPEGGTAVRLAMNDGTPGPTADSISVFTDGAGMATVLLQQVSGGTLPDSAVVHAIAVTAAADSVPGSPVRFVVTFP